MRVLTAIDGSREATHALRLSCRLAQQGAVAPVVLPVVDPRKPDERAAVDELVAAIARDTGITPTTAADTRPISRKLLALLARDYDLCVIGTHDGLGFSDFMLGDRMIRLARRVETPTLIVRGELELRRVLWRIPFAPVGPRHEHSMCRLLDLTRASVSLFLARPRASMYAFDRDGGDGNAVRAIDQHGFIAEIRKRLHAQTGYLPDYIIRSGIPEEVLLAEAQANDYDLIAVSARKRRGIGKWFADDLPYYVALHAPVSVLMLR